MRITPRAMWDDRTKDGATIVTASSSAAGFAKERVIDPRRSKTWRSSTGWSIVVDRNDRLNFTEAAARVATVAAANYTTGGAEAAAVQTAMNAAAVDNTYLVTYDTGTNKFTIARDTGSTAYSLDFGTGPDVARDIAQDIGFDETDHSGSTTYVGDFAISVGTHFLEFDLSSAQDARAALVVGTNLSSSGSLTVRGDSAGDFIAPSFTLALTAGDLRDPGKFVGFFTTIQNLRYWQLLFKDFTNTDGYIEAGAVFIGPYSEFARAYALNTAQPREELSEIDFAEFGDQFVDRKPTRRSYGFEFRETSDADHDEWQRVADAKRIGHALFYALDPLNSPVDKTVYGYIQTPGISFVHLRSLTTQAASPVGDWNIRFPFIEAV